MEKVDILERSELLSILSKYFNAGWHLLPIIRGKKFPPMEEWEKKASIDFVQIDKWIREYPNCGWGVKTGKQSGIFAVDLDRKDGKDGVAEWKKLLWESDEKEALTLVCTTVNGGERWFYRFPEGIFIPMLISKIAPGIDIQGDPNQAIIPPTPGYEWKSGFDSTKIADAPEWLLEIISSLSKAQREQTKALVIQNDNTDEIVSAVLHLKSLNPERADDYQTWIEVGMALSELGDDGLNLWNSWSRQSKKYKPGECAEKWRTFKPNEGLTLSSLRFWASKDNPDGLISVPQAPSKPKPSQYKRAILSAGWDFKLNEANLNIEVNDIPLSRPIKAVLHNQLREHGYTSMPTVMDCFFELAHNNRYHPIKEYLEGITWDGEDHISKLASHFKDKHGVFGQWFKRWLIGAVARVYKNGTQNRMLVLDGRQNLGKSYFVRWLADEVRKLHLEGPIHPETKDDDMRLMNIWIWEVAELGSTFRKADRESLKFFISKEKVTVRKPYDREDTDRPAITSFIGTINNEVGFLSDPTGHRRFMVCTLTDINWDYAKDVEISQVWAQAFHLFKKDEPWNLTKEEVEKAAEINSEYELENPLEEYIRDFYDVDPLRNDWFTPTREILDALKIHDLTSGTDRSMVMQIGSVLRKWKLEKTKMRVNGKQKHGWVGITRLDVEEVG